MTIKPAGNLPPGLLIVPGGVTGDYTRQLVTAKGTSYSWIGSTAPVTYSTTITNSPGTNNPGFQSVIFFVPPGTLGDRQLIMMPPMLPNWSLSTTRTAPPLDHFNSKPTNQPAIRSLVAAAIWQYHRAKRAWHMEHYF